MTTMNNEDPADPSVHEQRELPEPAAWRVYFPDEQREELASSLDELCDDLTNCAHDEPEPLYTADQMREAIAAERGRGAKPPKWWTCKTHGDARSNAWGCPECVRELRGEKAVLEGWITSALGVLRTLESEDSEDGGEELRKLLDAGKRLVCKHPAKQIKNFTYGMRSHCPDCGHSEESWWD